ncbi:glycosyltransferase [Pedobacter sp. P351]|uniref:glycosyltransferase n=1 Tax=Pedobacter superstes TaxID=3133441 RepID=UPI0030AE62AD
MHILIVNNTQIPAHQYGGTERVIWWLGKELVKKGHRVSFLVQEGSSCDFAEIIPYDFNKTVENQTPEDVDLVHFFYGFDEKHTKPSIYTLEGNHGYGQALPLNTVFVSKNHAERFGSKIYVHNGLDFNDYGDPGLDNKREYYHFLAKAAWRVKNVKGAIEIINKCKEKLVVLGGTRINLKMGLRITPYLNIKFKGMIGGERKNEVLRHSKGLIFPVLWHEPFGIAITESLYFGCPVFGTPYGSLPELVPSNVGFLSVSITELIDKIKNNDFDAKTCHDYVVENFSSELMTERYLGLYQKVLNGEHLNSVEPSLQIQQTEKFLPFYT